MNLYMKLFGRVMAPEDGGEGSAGGGAVDRGDELPDFDDASDDNATADKAAAADTEADDSTESADDKDDQPRDASGKFAKKDRGDEDRIPKSRFDEQVGKERAAREAAERRAAELEAKLQQEAKSVDIQKMEDNIESLEKQHAKFLLDGDADKAADVMKQIRKAERQIATLEAETKLSAAQERAVEQVRMDAAIAKLEADYTVFNPDSETYDQDIVDIVLAEQRRLMQVERMLPSAALTKAATKIMTKFQPAVTDGEKGKGLGVAKGDDRKAEQVKKNLDTAAKQPASMRDSGKDSDKAGEGKIDVMSLTQSEFAALPEATKRKLRGDSV